MAELNARVAAVPMPENMQALPVSPKGYPVPYFVQKEPLDFRVIDPVAYEKSMFGGRCWICGKVRPQPFAFVAGPMCGINRTSSEPPSHIDCAEFAARACPFLSQPGMRRNLKDLPEGSTPGLHLDRNPGVTMLWITDRFSTFQAHVGQSGLLVQMGEPLSIRWYAEGRPATRAEVFASIDSGLPTLVQFCEQEPTERRRKEARAELALRTAWIATKAPPA